MGSTEEEIRERFGPPEFRFITSEKTYYVYRNRPLVSGVGIFLPMPPLAVPFPATARETHCSRLQFGISERLERFEVSRVTYYCKNAFWSEEEFAKGVVIADGLVAVCMAAHSGSAEARITMAHSYRDGWGVEKNILPEYVWYTLASDSGSDWAMRARQDLSDFEMTPNQIAEAERMVAEWKPNPAECELIAAQVD